MVNNMTIDGEKITEFSIVGEEGGIFEFYKPLTTLQEVYEKLKEIKETDRKIREDLKKPSIYALTHEEKLKIAKYLKERFYAGTSQLNRCLSLHL